MEFNQLTFIQKFKFNLRWGSLLKEERERVDLTTAELAEMFELDPIEVARWETGFGSPMASLFYSIMVLFGPVSYNNAADLWYAIQIERYHQLKASGATAHLQRHKKNNYEALGFVGWTARQPRKAA